MDVMEYFPLHLIPLLFYPFALQYLRTGEINHGQLVLMGGVVVAMGPRLLEFWMSIDIPKLFRDSWLLIWMVGLTIWAWRHRDSCWHKEFSWTQNPSTPAERLAASVAVLMFIGFLVLIIVSYGAKGQVLNLDRLHSAVNS